MGEWIRKPLGDICNITKGIQINRTELYDTGNYYVINGGIGPSGYYDLFNTEANTISISEGGNSCGYVALHKERFWSGGHNYTLNKLDITLEYLYQYLKYTENLIMGLRVGTGLPNIHKKALEQFAILYPVQNAEQRTIAEILITADESIDKTCALIEKYTSIKTGMMQDLLLDNKWVHGVFNDIAEINPHTPKNIPPLEEADFIAMYDVNENGIWAVKQTRRAQECMTGFAVFQENDVLFAKITPCMENGKGCIVEGLRHDVGFGSTELHVLRPKPNTIPRFVYQWSIFPYLREKAIGFMTGSAGQQRVTANFFETFPMGIPPKPEQQRIADILTAADEKIQTERRYLAKLLHIKNGLMQDLFDCLRGKRD